MTLMTLLRRVEQRGRSHNRLRRWARSVRGGADQAGAGGGDAAVTVPADRPMDQARKNFITKEVL